MALLNDATSPVVKTSATTTAVTVSFTPVANSTITAKCVVGNFSGSGSVTGTVTDSLGSSWSMLSRFNAASVDSVELWSMNAGASPAARTVTLTGTVTNGKGLILEVDVWTGAQPAATLLGASATGTAATVALVIGTAGSFALVALGDNASSGSYTAAAGNTLDQSFNDATNGQRSATGHSTVTLSPGSFTAGFVGTVSTAKIGAWEIKAATASAFVARPRLVLAQSIRRASTR